MRTHIFLLMLLGVVAIGCGDDNSNDGTECILDSHCDRRAGGDCVTAPSGKQWCSYADTSCPSDLRYDERDVGDDLAGMCVAEEQPDAGTIDAMAPIDAGTAIDASTPDATLPFVQWDLVYPRRIRCPLFTFGVLGGEGQHMVINVGTLPMDMSTMTPGTSTDDHVGANFDYIVATPAPSLNLSPNSAIGMLPAAQQGLVPETVALAQAILRYSGELFPADGSSVTIEVTNIITIAGATVTFPQTWEIADVAVIQALDWVRVSSNVYTP